MKQYHNTHHKDEEHEDDLDRSVAAMIVLRDALPREVFLEVVLPDHHGQHLQEGGEDVVEGGLLRQQHMEGDGEPKDGASKEEEDHDNGLGDVNRHVDVGAYARALEAIV